MTGPPDPGRFKRLRTGVEQRPRAALAVAGAGLVVLIGAVVIGLALLLGGETGSASSKEVVITPAGEEAPRLGPVVVHLPHAPADRDGVLSVSPAIDGETAWLDSRTVLFQPAYPGFQRGAQYLVHVSAERAGLEADVEQSFTVEGRLAVQQVIPADGEQEVPVEAQILVQFNRSVAPLTTLEADDAAAVLDIEPALEGEGEWLNTSLYRFTPSDLRPSTTYSVRVPAGLTSAADGVLEADVEWSFSTAQPALASSTPADDTQFVPLDEPLVLRFNQPMDRASVAEGLSIDGDGDVAGTLAWSEGDRVATFTPEDGWEQSTEYTVRLAEGLAGANGGASEDARTISFHTVDPPTLVQTEPADGATDAGRFGIRLVFNNPVDVDSVADHLSVSGIDEQELQVEGFDSAEVFVAVPLEPSTEYTVTLEEGAVDRSGQPIPAASFSFTTGALPSSVSFALPGQVVTYSASAEPVLYAHVTNLEEASFALYALDPAQAAEIVATGQIPKAASGNEAWTPPSEPLRTWSEPIEGEDDVVRLISTSLTGGGPLEPGDYYLVSTGGDWLSQAMISVVDTALVTKLAHDQLLVWALDYETGEPLEGAAVSVNGPGLADASVTTDADGLASFVVPTPREVVDEPRAYVARIDDAGRRGVASTMWQTGSEPWQLDLPLDYYPQRYVTHVYTDRPIYRPGESVSFKGVVRANDDARYSIPDPAPALELVVRDAAGSELMRRPVTLNRFGTFAGDLRLPEGAATGLYQVELSVPGPERYLSEFIGYAAFRVAEFRPPEFEVQVDAGPESLISGDLLEASVNASYFFGGAVRDADVRWAVLASDAPFSPEGFERFSFNDFDPATEAELQDPLRAEREGATDSTGNASFELRATLLGNEGPQRFDVTATVEDANQQTVTGTTAVTVHPAAVYAGIAPAEYVARTGEEASIDVLTVDTSGQPVGGRDVEVRIYEREWVTVKEQTAEGARRYRSEPRDTLVETIEVTTGGNGAISVEYTPEQPGELRLVAETADASGRTARAATSLWVAGAGEASWQVRNDDVLELVADREQYEVGETAEVLVPAPYEDMRALITIERGSIRSQEVRTLASTSETLRIPIGDGSLPNVFVGVVLYRPPTAEDPLPRYKVGYAQLRVSPEPRRLRVDVEPDREEAQPGETVTYNVQVRDAEGEPVEAELSFAVVDEAVLSLAEEVGPDGLRAFWYERGLGVQTSSSLAVSVDRANDVISEPDAGGKGGGDEDGTRQDFRNTAFWEGQIATGADGHAEIEVTLPDNLTAWRAQARAVSGDTLVGEGTAEVVATQPLLLRPALPRFLRTGDEVRLRALLQNNTDGPLVATVTLEADGVELDGETQRRVTVEAGQAQPVEWPASVVEPGTAQLRMSVAATGGHADSVALELPVLRALTPETTATGGEFGDEPRFEALYVPEFAVLEDGALDVAVQDSLVGALEDELDALAPETYESIVRVASRVIATVGAHRARGEEAIDGQVEADVVALVSRQRVDGGWGWCRECSSDLGITALVLQALGDARAAGRAVDEAALARATSFVMDRINQPSDVADPLGPDVEAALLWTLLHATGRGTAGGPAPGGAQATSMLQAIAEQRRAELSNFGRAALLLGLDAAGTPHDSQLVRALVTDLSTAAIASATGAHWEDTPASDEERAPSLAALRGNLRVSALAVHALATIDPDHPLLVEAVRWLTTARSAQRWTTNAEIAGAVAALGRYAEATGDRPARAAYEVQVDSEPLLSGRFEAEGVRVDRERLPLEGLGVGVHRLRFAREDGSGRLHYNLALRYQTPATDVAALNRGFAVSHEYSLLEAPDERIDEAPLGATVRVRVTVVADADHQFVRVDDLLPAGLEPVDTSLSITSPELRSQLEADRREAAGAAGDATAHFAPWYRWYYSPWQQVDVRDDRVTMYASQLPAGVHEYVYYARATTAGDFFVAPAHAAEEFFPEVFGRSDSGRFAIR